MADSAGYDTSVVYGNDLWKANSASSGLDATAVFASDLWKQDSGLNYYEPHVASSYTVDVGGGGVTIDGGRANPLCPRFIP